MVELRLAMRRLGRRPGHAAIAVLTLGLGIAASTVSFGAVQAVLLEALPVVRQDEVMVVWHENPARDFVHLPFRPRAVDVVEEHTTAFASVGAVATIGAQAAIAEGSGGPFTIEVARVDGDFFGTLGARPVVGRVLHARDAEPGADPVAVLSHDYWTGAHGGDTTLVGTRLRIRDRSYVVVGVAEDGLDYPDGVEAWVTYAGSDPVWNRGESLAELDIVARLRAGVTPEEAGRQANQVLRQDPDFSETYSGVSPVVVPIAERIVGSFASVLHAGMAASVLLLLVAVANATLLFLSGGARSVREVAVRRALGAGRRRVLAPVMFDAAVTAVLAVAVGVVLAWLAVGVLLPLAPDDLPRLDGTSVDGRALAFAALAGILAMVGSGGLAGLWMTRGSPRDVLVEGGVRLGGPGGEKLRRAIAATQVAFAVVAAFGAGLLVRTVGHLDRLDRGFHVTDLHIARIDHGHALFNVPESYVRDLRQVADALTASPDLIGATPTVNAPLDFNNGVEIVPVVEDQSDTEVAGNPFVSLDAVLPGYFDLVGMEVLEGRALQARDDPQSPRVVVINRSAARVLWGEGSPLGKRIAIYPGQPEAWATVVGIVGDSRYRSFPEPRPAAWVALAQYSAIPPGRLLVRTRGRGVGVRELIAEALSQQAPYARVISLASMEEVMREPMLLPRFARAVLLTFATVALVLAGLGVYGVFALLVQERSKELGVRKAVGARDIHLVRFVAARVLTVGAIGVGMGLAAGMMLSGILGQLVYGIETGDVRNLFAVVVATLSAALLAGIVPTWQATRADPGCALRME